MQGTFAGRYGRYGRDWNSCGDLRAALAGQINEAPFLSLGLDIGEVVAIAICATPLDIEPGEEVRMELARLGASRLSDAPTRTARLARNISK